MSRRFGVLTLVTVALVLVMAMPGLAADITLSKNVTPSEPKLYVIGDTIHYVMSVTNNHASEIIRIEEVTDSLPDGTLVVLDSTFNPASLLEGVKARLATRAKSSRFTGIHLENEPEVVLKLASQLQRDIRGFVAEGKETVNRLVIADGPLLLLVMVALTHYQLSVKQRAGTSTE